MKGDAIEDVAAECLSKYFINLFNNDKQIGLKKMKKQFSKTKGQEI